MQHYSLADPLFTSVLPDIGQLKPLDGSLYITGASEEERNHHTSQLERAFSNVTFARVTRDDRSRATISVQQGDVEIRLRSIQNIIQTLAMDSYTAVYLDITGLDHHVWAPLLRAIRRGKTSSFCVYVEPGDYRFSSAPTEATIFDLSERIDGIGPLPGFASLTFSNEPEALFVPLLGFEGARFTFMLEAVQPIRNQIYPVIGVPGFRPEYPFHAYLGNRLPLTDTRAWQNVRFVLANCPFSLYHMLSDLSRISPHRSLKIALIGTKPHALGALLYYLDHSSTAEIIYDHPTRKAKRTVGTFRTCLYDLSLLPPVRPERGILDG